jgi:hypothetical protein
MDSLKSLYSRITPKLLLEAFVFGVLTVLVGLAVKYAVGHVNFFKVDRPEGCSGWDWNKHYVLEGSLFLTGFCMHLVSQLVGVDRWADDKLEAVLGMN